MPSVGTAYVNIRVNTSGFEKSLNTFMARLSSKMEGLGTKMGKDLDRGMAKANVGKGIADSVEKNVTKAGGSLDRLDARVERTANTFTKMGTTGGDALDTVRTKAEAAAPSLSGVGRAARGVERDVSGVADEAENAGRAIKNMGGSGGGSGFRKLSNDMGFFQSKFKELVDFAPKGSSILAGLHDAAAFAGTGLAGLAGTFSAAAQGAFVFASQLAAAAPALATFAAGIIGLAQTGGVLAISMQGVGKALTAGFSSLDKTALAATAPLKGISDAAAGAARAVRDAKIALQRAYQDAARSAADAARRTMDAESALAASQHALIAAQKELNAARADGLEQLKQIGFAAEDAALSEQQASLDLEDAYIKLQAVSGLPPDDRARVDAELQFKQAELNLREAKDARQQADKDQAEATKKGLQGTDAMVNAHKDVADAQQDVADKTKDLSDARRDEARTAVDNAQKIADAQRRLADAMADMAKAQKTSATATKAASTAVDQYALALSKLSPQQQIFVKHLISLRDEWQKARGEIADPLFKGLNESLNILVDGKLLPQLKTQLEGTSGVLGDLAVEATKTAESGMFRKALTDTMKSNNKALRNFGGGAINLGDAFVQLADAAGPTLRRFSRWFETMSEGVDHEARLGNRTGELGKKIHDAGDKVSEFWDLAKQLWRTLKILGSAANEAADGFDNVGKKKKVIGWIPDMTDSLKTFNDQLKHRRLVQQFGGALQNLDAAGRAIGAVVKPLVRLGSDPNVQKAMDIIANNKSFDKLGGSATSALPQLAKLAGHVLDILAALSDTHSIDNFISILDFVAGNVAWVVKQLDRFKLALEIVGIITGTTLAIRKLWQIGKVLSSPFVTATKAMWNLGKGAVNLTKNLLTGNFKAAWQQISSPFRKKNKSADVDAAKAGQSVTDSYADGIKAGLPQKDAAMNALRANVEKMLTEMKVPLETTATATGRAVVQGLVLGLEEGTASVVAAGEAAGRDAATAVGKGAQTMSPSRLTIPVGTGIVQGVTIGMEEAMAPAVVAANTAGAEIAGGVGAGASVATGELAALDGAMATTGAVAETSSVGVRAFGTAMSAVGGPLGIIMIAFPILLPILQKLNEKFHITTKIMDALTAAFNWLWKTVKPVVNAIWGVIQEAFNWIIDHWKLLAVILFGPFAIAVGLIIKYRDQIWDAIKAVFNWVKDNWKMILLFMVAPFAALIVLVVKHWGAILDFIKTIPDKLKALLGKMWDFIKIGLDWLWDHVKGTWGKVLNFIKSIPNKIWNLLKDTWKFYIKLNQWLHDKIWSLFNTILTFLKGIPGKAFNALKTIWNVLGNFLKIEWAGLKIIWGKITSWIRGFPGQVTNLLSKVWDVLKDKLSDAWTWVVGKWADIKRAISGWPDAIKNSLKHIWDGMGTGLISAINWVGDKVNWMIDKINGVLDKFGAPKITVQWPMRQWTGFAEGGPVRGPGGPKSDRIPAMLSNNEHVLTAAEVRAFGGHKNVAAMRQAAVRGEVGGTGGIWGGIKSVGGGIVGGIKSGVGAAYDTVKDALKKGAEIALRWIIDQFKDQMGDDDNLVKKVVLGAIEWGSENIFGFGRDQDEAAAAALASSAGSGPDAVWRALRSVGFSKVQTAGIMGSIQSESNFDPLIVQGGGHSLNPAAAGGSGYGLVQWTPGSKLIPYLNGQAPSINSEITALAAQLAGRGPSPEAAAGAALRAATTVYEAARAFELQYERHAGPPQPNRISQAMAWYNKFKGSDALSSAGAVPYDGPPTGWTYAIPKSIHTYNYSGHSPSSALDMGAQGGTPVVASSGGSVLKWGDLGNTSYGKYIVLSHAGGWQTLYAHLSEILKKSGRVRPGTLIGRSGNTGGVRGATGYHLHLEITKKYGSSWYPDTHRQAVSRGLNWPYRYGGAWAKGGVIGPQNDGKGVLALLAEAGKAERITPLDSEGFTPAERRMLEALESSLGTRGGGDQIHVHPSRGMDETAVADLVLRRVAWKHRRGAGGRR